MQKEKQSSGAKANTSESDVSESGDNYRPNQKALRDISRMLWGQQVVRTLWSYVRRRRFAFGFSVNSCADLYEVCLSLVSARRHAARRGRGGGVDVGERSDARAAVRRGVCVGGRGLKGAHAHAEYSAYADAHIFV